MITATIAYVDFDPICEPCLPPLEIDQVHADGRLIMTASASGLGYRPPAGRQNFLYAIRSFVSDDVVQVGHVHRDVKRDGPALSLKWLEHATPNR